MRLRLWLWRLRWPTLFVAVVLLYVWPLTRQPLGVAYPPGSAFTDLLVSHLPNAGYARQTLWEHGQWPLWNAQLFGGQPFAADPLAGVWYPPAWLLLAPGLPLTLGFNLLLALHLAWGGLGVYRLLRAEGVSGGPALLGGLAFAGAPKLVAHLGAGHVGLVFAVTWTPWLLAAVRGAVARGGMLRGAVAGACLALTFLADVRWANYAGVLAVAYGFWHWAARRREAQSPQGGHRGPSQGFSILDFGPKNVLPPSPLLARALGFRGQERGRAGDGVRRARLSSDYRKALRPPLLRALLGFVVFAVLLSAVLALPLLEFIQYSNRAALTLEEAAVYSLPPVSLLGVLIRDVGGFHEHMTYAGTVPLLLALLGLGRRTWFWLAASLLAAAFALGTNFVLFPLLFRFVPGLGLLRVPPRAWFVVALALCVLAGHGAHMLTETLWPKLMSRYANVRIRLPSAATALAVMGVVTVLDLARFNASLLEVRPLPALNPASRWLLAQPGRFRVYSPSYSLPAGDGLAHVDGVDPLQLAASAEFLEVATGVRAEGYSETIPAFRDGLPAVANREAVPEADRLGLLNVRYVAAEFPIAHPRLALVQTYGLTRVYENRAWRERAWLADGTAADIARWSPNRIEVTATGPGRLVLSEVAYPGWQVTVNGRAATLLTEHDILQAVDLPAGPQRVVFSFRPFSVFLGATLSALGCVGLLGLLWRGRPAAW